MSCPDGEECQDGVCAAGQPLYQQRPLRRRHGLRRWHVPARHRPVCRDRLSALPVGLSVRGRQVCEGLQLTAADPPREWLETNKHVNECIRAEPGRRRSVRTDSVFRDWGASCSRSSSPPSCVRYVGIGVAARIGRT
jgi:hypothetical protein